VTRRGGSQTRPYDSPRFFECVEPQCGSKSQQDTQWSGWTSINVGSRTGQISDIISEKRTPWAHITEHLLRSKVQAEADLSTRL